MLLRSMEHAKPAKVAMSPKNFILFRSGANALPSRASFPIQDRVKIPTSNTEKWTVFTEPSLATGRNNYAQGANRDRSWRCGARRRSCQGRRGVGQAGQGSEAV